MATEWFVITRSLKVHLINSKLDKLCRRSSIVSSRSTHICVSITRKPFLDYANWRRQERRHLRFRSPRDVTWDRPKSSVTYCWHVNLLCINVWKQWRNFESDDNHVSMMCRTKNWSSDCRVLNYLDGKHIAVVSTGELCVSGIWTVSEFGFIQTELWAINLSTRVDNVSSVLWFPLSSRWTMRERIKFLSWLTSFSRFV